MVTLGVALAAGLGAVLRHVVDHLVQRRTRGTFPLGTIVVNVSGSFVLGLATGLALHHGLGPTATVLIGSGFAGGYTTLSTWAVETLVLVERGEPLAASANALGSVIAGLASAAAGLGLALL